MNNSKTLTLTTSSNSTIGENYAERVLFLIPEKYGHHNLSDYTCQINIISPDEINGDVITASLIPSTSNKGYLEFYYDIPDEYTAQIGYISFWIKFLGIDNSVIINTVGEVRILIKERKGIEGYIPEHSLSLLDEWTLKMEENNQISEEFYNKSEDAKLLSESYARGDTGVRENENTDNAKYYKEQTQILRNETKDYKNQSAESEYNAKQSEIKVIESEQNVVQIKGVVDGILHDIIEIEENVIETASGVEVLANNVAEDRNEIENLKNQTIENANNAAESEESAKRASTDAKSFRDETEEFTNNAKESERLAEEAKETAIENRNDSEQFAIDAEISKQAIENMTVTSETLQPDELVGVEKTIIDDVVNLHYKIPQGVQGETGNVFLPIFYIDDNMELVLTYDENYIGNIDFEIDNNGCLILEAIR